MAQESKEAKLEKKNAIAELNESLVNVDNKAILFEAGARAKPSNKKMLNILRKHDLLIEKNKLFLKEETYETLRKHLGAHNGAVNRVITGQGIGNYETEIPKNYKKAQELLKEAHKIEMTFLSNLKEIADISKKRKGLMFVCVILILSLYFLYPLVPVEGEMNISSNVVFKHATILGKSRISDLELNKFHSRGIHSTESRFVSEYINSKIKVVIGLKEDKVNYDEIIFEKENIKQLSIQGANFIGTTLKKGNGGLIAETKTINLTSKNLDPQIYIYPRENTLIILNLDGDKASEYLILLDVDGGKLFIDDEEIKVDNNRFGIALELNLPENKNIKFSYGVKPDESVVITGWNRLTGNVEKSETYIYPSKGEIESSYGKVVLVGIKSVFLENFNGQYSFEKSKDGLRPFSCNLQGIVEQTYVKEIENPEKAVLPTDIPDVSLHLFLPLESQKEDFKSGFRLKKRNITDFGTISSLGLPIAHIISVSLGVIFLLAAGYHPESISFFANWKKRNP